MNAEKYLRDIMEKYTADKAKISPDEFEHDVRGMLFWNERNKYYGDEIDIQRNQSIDFVWGHNHDFGSFFFDGQMGYRHIEIINKFVTHFGLPRDLSGQRILDVGVWCGGTTLLLSGMGGEFIDGVEEVEMYANCANYLLDIFNCQAHIRPLSLYSFYDLYVDKEFMQGFKAYDTIIFPGVLYHLSDPLLALRMLFNMLKDGGELYIETMTTDIYDRPACEYHGAQKKGWNWFAPNPEALTSMLMDVGFEPSPSDYNLIENNRLITKAVRKKWKPMLKAGLSRKIR